MKKHHKFTHTHVEHHNDGSHTVHHVHEEGPHKDVKSAAANHDAMIDHIMDHTSAPNAGEGNDVNNAALAGPAAGTVAPPAQAA